MAEPALSATTRSIIHARLHSLYGDRADDVQARLDALVDDYAPRLPQHDDPRWSHQDAVLITYGDQVRSSGQTPLAALAAFLQAEDWTRRFSTVHILPCFPYTSDDGFSVVDYEQIDPHLGTWDDIEALGEQVDLMLDLVLNHCSKKHGWFQKYLAGEEPFTDYFIAVDPETDLSEVTRPRSLPLLTAFETVRGPRHVWTTFSADQVDLNVGSPDVLLELINILLLYVEHGARIIRLDAVAYLWKQIGTSCIHLQQTHTIVKLMRDVMEAVAPHVLLMTETNVPHRENVSYFGSGDEAHMVYQFSLAPLLLDALLTGDVGPLNDWLFELEPCQAQTTYFNFTASHDGIGVRPLEGLVSPERRDGLIEAVRARGGEVSTRSNADGSESPYEFNITWFSAMGEPEGMDAALHARRFLTSQAVMLSLRGIPGVYFHSLIGTPNDTAGVEATGLKRTINRRKYDREELATMLDDAGSAQRLIYDGYRQLLAVRGEQPAFHPDGGQEMLPPQETSQLAFVRTSTDRQQRVLVLANCGSEPTTWDLSLYEVPDVAEDLLGNATIVDHLVTLPAWGVAWLT